MGWYFRCWHWRECSPLLHLVLHQSCLLCIGNFLFEIIYCMWSPIHLSEINHTRQKSNKDSLQKESNFKLLLPYFSIQVYGLQWSLSKHRPKISWFCAGLCLPTTFLPVFKEVVFMFVQSWGFMNWWHNPRLMKFKVVLTPCLWFEVKVSDVFYLNL